MKRLACIGLCAVLGAAFVHAEPVDSATARLAAERWLQTCTVFIVEGNRLRGETGYTIRDITPIASPGNPTAAYHVSLDPVGYIVVSGEKRITPVVCFSTTSDLNLDDVPENALRALLMNDLVGSYAVLSDMDSLPRRAAASETADSVNLNQSRWSELLDAPGGRDMWDSDYTPTNILVYPMLETAWTQWRHYNYKCPVDTNEPANPGYDGKAPVGCVPVNGAQTMKYHEWPPFGGGSHSYDDNAGDITAQHSAVFSDTYDWDHMKTNYNWAAPEPTNEVEAISELMYELGVSVNIDYNHGGSSASLQSLQDAMTEYFYFACATNRHRDDDTDAFDQNLRDDILAGLPVPVILPSHAIVTDGLSSDAGSNYFHFNYGWAGDNDGWYQPSNVNSNSLVDGLFGLQPLFMPLQIPLPGGTNTAGVFTNTWAFPGRRTNEVACFRLREGVYVPTNFSDTGDQFDRWEQDGAPWTNRATGGNPDACYYKPNAKVSDEGSIVSEPFVPGTDTVLRFDYKVQLYQDHFYTELTTNDGDGWIELLHATGYPAGYTNGWWSTNFSLSAYAGTESRIRFRYDIGSYWNGDYGCYVDNISYSNIEMLSWIVIDSNISASTRSYKINSKLDGTYYYLVDASDGTNWGPSPPRTSVHIDLDPNGDTDEDGMANYWEDQHFGSPTGAIATADSDGDTMCDWDEWWTGCDPTNGGSIFTADAQSGTNWNIVKWPSITGRTYAVYRTTNLVHTGFSCLASNLEATPIENSYEDTNAPGLGPHYYKVLTEY